MSERVIIIDEVTKAYIQKDNTTARIYEKVESDKSKSGYEWIRRKDIPLNPVYQYEVTYYFVGYNSHKMYNKRVRVTYYSKEEDVDINRYKREAQKELDNDITLYFGGMDGAEIQESKTAYRKLKTLYTTMDENDFDHEVNVI